MKTQFFCHGHQNILATHPTTLEFTKHPEVTQQGDCIIGVKADFRPESVQKLLVADKLKISMEIGDHIMIFHANVNRTFTDHDEIVFRKSGFLSRRTLGIHATKVAIDLPAEFREKLKNPKTRMSVTIETV